MVVRAGLMIAAVKRYYTLGRLSSNLHYVSTRRPEYPNPLAHLKFKIRKQNRVPLPACQGWGARQRSAYGNARQGHGVVQAHSPYDQDKQSAGQTAGNMVLASMP